jgi:hypothetical protein
VHVDQQVDQRVQNSTTTRLGSSHLSSAAGWTGRLCRRQWVGKDDTTVLSETGLVCLASQAMCLVGVGRQTDNWF